MDIVSISTIIGILGIRPTIFLLSTGIVGLIGIVFLIIKNKTQVGFVIGPFKLNLGKGNQNASKDCINSILELQETKIKSIFEVEAEYSKRQISYTEQKLSQLKYILISSYADELVKKLIHDEDVRLHKDYRSYQILCTVLMKELVDKIFRTAFIENHLDEYDPVSWDSYLADKSNYIINYISEFMDIMYGDGKVLSRKESAKVESDKYTDIRKLIKEIFENIREMNRGFNSETKKIKESFENKILELCKKHNVEMQTEIE